MKTCNGYTLSVQTLLHCSTEEQARGLAMAIAKLVVDRTEKVDFTLVKCSGTTHFTVDMTDIDDIGMLDVID